MLAVTGKSVSQLYREITHRYGTLHYEEVSCKMTPQRKAELQKLVFEDGLLPTFVETVVKINREDGCKVYFEDGSWVIFRFSGTEPLLRMAAEGNTPQQAKQYVQAWRSLLEL